MQKIINFLHFTNELRYVEVDTYLGGVKYEKGNNHNIKWEKNNKRNEFRGMCYSF